MIGMGMGRGRAVLAVFTAMIALLGMAPKAFAVGETPRTFNLYIRNYYEPGDAAILARYDAVGLDVDTPVATLNAIKAINPSIKLLAYIPINGTYQSAPLFPAGSKWREMYDAAEANGWWLENTQGGHIYDHAGKYTVNITTVCPPNGSGQTMLDWYPQFIVNSVLQNGAAAWDGVILDDVWVGIWFVNNNAALNPLPIDADQDGVQDDQPTLDQRWKDGNDLITQRIRATMPAGEILMGNGGNQFYHMNGAMIENFPFRGAPDVGHPLGYTWTDKMFGTLGYFNNETNYSTTPQRLDVVNAKWQSGDRYSATHTPEYGRHLRFCLASSMLRDGYFSMDFEEPTAGHHSLWWEPEFDKPIGTPTGAPYQVTYNGMTLWRRDYTNGVVVLNNNYTTFQGSAANGIPPIGWVDARVLLTSEMWAPESTPPAAINDLTITRTWPNQLEIQWTNVGDNGINGQAVEVQARYSLSPINEGNWASAAVASGTVVPELPGIEQLRLISGLNSNALYYVAVKTKDLAGNWSAISNVPSATTVVSDVTAPNAVTNLSVVSTTSTGATVQWTTTGDDGNTGTASSFDLRYATYPLNASNFSTGAAVVGEPTPGSPGTLQSQVLYGMVPFTTYYFAVKVGDEMPNWSTISNVPSGTTQAGDITPPSDIIDLAVIGVGPNSVTLQWTAPGDDGNVGRATQYDLRYSPNPMTAANYSSANFITSEPGPQNAGTVQTMTINGFGSDRTYWFAMKSSDEFPNTSGISNIVSATTNQPLPGDTTPPAAIANLAVTGSTTTAITLSWTAPGDDGTTGTATSYDLRYSTSNITAANFATATTASGEPVVGASGTTQGMTVSGLSPGVQYHFALKTADEVPNWSTISNSPTGTTQLAVDTTPPSAVANLALGTWTATSVLVSWTAPGDDNAAGTAASYDLRYSTSAITAANFGSATAVTGEPAPAAAGTSQNMTVSGLTAGTTYFFALKTIDEVPNTSTISNVPTGSTLPPPDVTAPAAVANLALGTWTQTSVVVSWTAPGDDNAAGTAASYDLRYSTSAITAANFGSATQVSGEPAPAVAGTAQNKTVTGLTAGTTYFFALKTSDEVPNVSTISNVPTGSTLPPPDVTAPAAVANLALGTWTQTSVVVGWTSPGDDNAVGTAASYDLRFSTSAITAANFASATAVSGEPAPAVAGTAQNMTVSGLTAGTTYFFALKTSDEVPNTSTISNVPTGSTLPPPDVTAPAAVANLALGTWTQTSVVVSWTAPGDDNAAGTAASYDLRFSTSAITAANFGSATQVSGEPAPAVAGTAQNKTVTGLTAGTTYFFALKTSDEIPNISTISNVPTGSTLPPPDVTAPAAVANLALGTWTQTSVVVSWTSPGDDNAAGTAASYDLRYSTSTITAANFGSATAVSGEPVPAIAGTTQNMTVSGLTAGTIYFFALKSSDEVPNTSTISNVPTGSTLPPPDVTAPAAVASLALGTWAQTSVLVSWTSPGDDNSTGTATSYDLRYSTSTITAANFGSATAVSGEPVPAIAGTTQNMTVSGLTAGTTYFFALKSSDEVPNVSAISNVPTGSTLPPPDVTAPAAVANLALGTWAQTSVLVSWTAPGDDNAAGTAASYDLRYSTSAITAANFGSATAVSEEPAPAVAGTAQSMTVSGLTAGTTYFFAIKTSDEVPNTSTISNVPTGATLPSPDTTVPSAIANLSLGTWAQTSVLVSWTSTGDDNSTGTATSYDLRYSTSAITAANFGSATPISGEPVPAVAGTTQSMTVSGLTAGTTYFFALKASDEVNNTSAISNVPTGSTLPPPDTTSPAAIANLSLGTWTQTSVLVSWTAPGDDNLAGTAASYDLRFSTSAITAANFSSATPVAGEPVPAIAGTTQSVTVSGLAAGTTYFFAMKSGDEVPNTSGISNVPWGSTLLPPDVTAPSAVANLSLGNWAQTSVLVSWTAPGDDNAAGTAASYDLRYSTSAITAANFGSATPVSGEPVPAIAGTTQNMTVSGLTAGTTYFFALKTSDEVPNTSTISNVPSGPTLPQPPVDTTPPAAITTLAFTGNTTTSLTVGWTSPGDDGIVGTATTYEMRWSTSPITAANFDAANLVNGMPAPLIAGTNQSITINGLTAGTTYHVALRTADEIPNWSSLSNGLVTATLDPPDVTPPAAVGDLASIDVTVNSITIDWSAPGDDGTSGTASVYDIRYRTGPITTANFGSSTTTAGEPAPDLPGTTQSFTIGGLAAGTTYWIALKTADEKPNWSSVSNVISVTTSLPPDVTPPGVIGNLVTGSWTTTTLWLTWTSTGDDGSTGVASLYDIRWSTAPITTANFDLATPIANEPVPAASGTSQNLQVTGLEPGTTYWFAMKSADEVPNWSSLSNVATGTTLDPPDATPPGLVNDLVAGTATMSSLVLTWTAPGDDGANGSATAYDLRRSTNPITTANFSGATPLAGEPAPAAAGMVQSMTASGLVAGTTYYFALKTADEIPNWSSIGNVATGTTLPPPDVTPPAGVGDLAFGNVASTSVTISWHAPGDDGLTGTATAYDLRWSTGPITADDFGSATSVSGVPAPLAPGTSQSVLLDALVPGQPIWAALRTRDEAGNWSALSNVPSTTPPVPADEIPPAAITSLVVSDLGPGWVTLGWLATGDDGTSGLAEAYDLRLSASVLTAATFGAADPIPGEPDPRIPGVAQSMTLTGLSTGVRYWAALKTVDESGNWSSISNVLVIDIPDPPDTTPPAEITLTLVRVDTTSAVLAWLAPGDDGTAGRATGYEMRRSESPLDETNFDAGLPVPSPAPGIAGSVESMTASGLPPGSTWWFAIRAIDDADNAGPLSTSLRVDTKEPSEPPDTAPPLAPVSLVVVRETEGAYLSWSPNLETDLVGYHVYRRPSGGVWQRRTDAPIADIEWHDPLDGRAGAWDYRVTAINVRGEESAPSAIATITITNPGGGAHLMQLSAPAPNPFTESTVIRLAVPAAGITRALVVVLDVRGRAVKTLHDGALDGGESTWEWNGDDDNGNDVPNGVYLVIVDAGTERSARKIVLAR